MGSKLDQDLSSDFFSERYNKLHLCNPANKQTNSYENNVSIVEVKK